MNKYNAKKVKYDGHTFDSKKEFERYLILKSLSNKGLIKDLDVHPRFIVARSVKFGDKTLKPIKYEADFIYFDTTYNRMIVEDVKGFKTALYKLKRSLFIVQYPEYTFKET